MQKIIKCCLLAMIMVVSSLALAQTKVIAPKIIPTVVSANVTAVPSDTQIIKDQLTQVNASIANLSAQVMVLESTNKTLQTQLDSLQQRMLSAEMAVTQLQHTSGCWLTRTAQWMQAQFGVVGAYIVLFAVVVVVILILLFLFSWCKCCKKEMEKIEPTISPAKDDFDLMNAAEGIAAKLNLARAYIDMGNIAAAQELLQTVVQHGNPEQQAEAQQLLGKIQSA